MILHRLIYVFTLIASFFFYILYPPWISWYLFVLLLLLIPLDLLVSLPGMLTKGILISVPAVLEKDADAVLKFTTTHTKSFPVRCIIAKLYVTGDDFSVTCRLLCPAENGAQREVIIDTSQSGLTVFVLKRISTVSLLGLFSLPVNAGDRRTVLILPPAIKPVNTVALQHGTHLRPKPGGGYSEEHDMRTYRQGDPIKSIHWKISAKVDSLIIREPLEPPPHSRLVHIVPWATAMERDLTLGRLRWISDYLLKWQMPFYLQFGDDVMIVEIMQDSDMVDFLRCVLDDTGINKPINATQVPARFSWRYSVDAVDGEEI